MIVSQNEDTEITWVYISVEARDTERTTEV